MNEKIVALSIGSKYISATMSKNEMGENKLIGSVMIESKGVTKGRIKDGELLTNSIEEVIIALKKQTREKIENLYVELSTEDVRLVESKGFCSLDKNKEIDKEQIEKAYIDGKNIIVENDECIVDAIINNFYTTENGYISNPLGLKSKGLEVELEVVVCKKEVIGKLKTILMDLGCEVNGFILGMEALNNYLNFDEEIKEKNNVIINFGAEKIEIGIFKRNKISNVSFIPLGGRNLTKDIAIITKIKEDTAEKIKIKNSGNFITLRNSFGKIPVENEKIEATLFYDVINARLEEIVSYIKKDLETYADYDKIDNVFILGEAIVNFEGIEEFLRVFFNKNTTIIAKKELNLENYSTIMSIAIVKEVHDRLKLLYKKDVFSIVLYNKVKDGNSKNMIFKDKSSNENKSKLSKVLGFLGDIF